MSLDIISFRTTTNHKRVVDAIAEKLGITRSEVMQQILNKYIQELAEEVDER